MNENELNDLILDTWSDFEELKVNPESAEVLIPNSMPLLWFGDLPAYEKSDLKILTVSKMHLMPNLVKISVLKNR